MENERNRSATLDDIVDHAHAFYRLGWALGTGGNLSARLPGRCVAITASGSHLGELEASDFVSVGLDDTELPGAASAETPIHLAIYNQLPATEAVYHVHDPHAALCSRRDADAGATRLEDFEMIKGLGIWEASPTVDIPIVDNHFEVSRIAGDITAILTSRDEHAVPGVNVAGHGVYAWGDSPDEARRHIECFAYLFECSWKSRQ